MSGQPGCDQDSPIPTERSNNLQVWRSGMGNGRFTVDGGGGTNFDHSSELLQQSAGCPPDEPRSYSPVTNYQSTPIYQHLAISSTQSTNPPYQFEGPNSVPTSFGWAGHQGGLNFTSVPSSPVFNVGFSHSVEHRTPQQLHLHTDLAPHRNEYQHNRFDSQKTRHHSLLTSQRPANDGSDSRLNSGISHPASNMRTADNLGRGDASHDIFVAHNLNAVSSNTYNLVGSAPPVAQRASQALANPNREQSWDSTAASSSVVVGTPKSTENELSRRSTPSLLVTSSQSDNQVQAANSTTSNTLGSIRTNELNTSYPLTDSLSIYSPVMDTSDGGRVSLMDSPTSSLSSFPHPQLSNAAGITSLYTADSMKYPLPSKLGSSVSSSETRGHRLARPPFQEPVSSASLQRATAASSLSACTSPASPYSSSWVGIRNSPSDNLSSPISAVLPFGKESWKLERVSESPNTESPTNQTVLAAEVWKTCGLKSVPTGDSLEQVVRKMREIGLNEDQIRHLSETWGNTHELKNKADEDRGGPNSTTNDDTESSILTENRQITEAKLDQIDFPENSHEENSKQVTSSDNPSDISVGGFQGSDSNTKGGPDPSNKLPSLRREPSIERGRRTRNSNRTVSYLDNALQADTDVAYEMEWRTHSRSRSRPPETTNMDWRQASRSRNRRPCRVLDLPPPHRREDEAGANAFFTSHIYKPLRIPSLQDTQGDPSSSCSSNPSQGFFSPLADCDSSQTGLKTVDERSSDGLSEYGTSQMSQHGYQYPQDILDNLVDFMNQNNEMSHHSSKLDRFEPSSAPFDQYLGSPFMHGHQHDMSAFDSCILGLPTTPSHSSLLGSIPGLNDALAQVANAHSEYGSIPRLVRKTSFDETLIQNNMPSILKRQSYLGPRTYREQGMFASQDGMSVDVGSSVVRNRESPNTRPSTAIDIGQSQDTALSLHETNLCEVRRCDAEDVGKLRFEANSGSGSGSMGNYLSSLNSVSGSSEDRPSSLAPAISVPLSNNVVNVTTSQASSTPSAPVANGSLNLTSAGNVHSALFDSSFGAASGITLQSSLSMNTISDYDMFPHLNHPFDDHSINVNQRMFTQNDTESVSFIDSTYQNSRNNELGSQLTVGISSQPQVSLSAIRPLSDFEFVPPVTINPAQLHPHRQTLAQPANNQRINHNHGGFNTLSSPSSGRSLGSRSSSSGSSDSSRASSLSFSTITGHRLATVKTLAKSPKITSGPTATLSSPVISGTTSPIRSFEGSALTSVPSSVKADPTLFKWTETDTLESQNFSGGRSSHLSSIGQARKRSKQLPYGPKMNVTNTAVNGSVSVNECNGMNKSNSANGVGSEIVRGADDQAINNGIGTEPHQPGAENQTSGTITLQCLNCRTTTTPLWRRNSEGKSLCNACGLFLNLHGIPRPASLSTGVIKRRNRGAKGEKGARGNNEKKSVKPKLVTRPLIDQKPW